MEKKAKVYFSGLKSSSAEEALLKLARAVPGILTGTTAVKVHFGERGNKTHLSSDLLAVLLKAIERQPQTIFVTDTNVLYRSERSRTVSHLNLAFDHGFCQEKLKVPVLIADGYDGGDVMRVKIDGEHFKNFPVGGAIFRADSLLFFSHFKGHLLAGAGGAIKNLSMGGASRAGKQMMHADVIPERRFDKICLKCGNCVDSCPESAIVLDGEGPVFDLEKCVGCGECITVCPEGVIKILWNSKPENFAEKLAEGAKAVISGKENRSVFINGLLEVTPECDCVSDAGAPMIDDLGWFMSTDPVAIDRACLDAVLQKVGHDIFKEVHPNTYFEKTLDYAEQIGLGTNLYELEEIK